MLRQRQQALHMGILYILSQPLPVRMMGFLRWAMVLQILEATACCCLHRRPQGTHTETRRVHGLSRLAVLPVIPLVRSPVC